MKTPPGISPKVFKDVLRQFEEAVGEQWVFSSSEDVALYRDAYSLFMDEPEERFATAAVAPDSVEEVQRVVKIANDYDIPIYPISTGKNLGYGGSAPVYSGSVVLDLKRMNRVLEVNERNAYAVVEPGVSYFDMYRHLQASKSKLWIDVPDPGWGSLIGNALDYGGGYTSPQYRNHFDAHCGIEAVLTNGEVLRTGMGAMPGAQTWQQYKYGYGPLINGLFKQSNFGVVTKMGFWLMPEPEAYMTGDVMVPHHADIIQLVDILNNLENMQIFNGLPGIRSPVLSRGVKDIVLTGMLEAPGDIEMEQIARETGIPCWQGHMTFYGPEKVIAAQWAYAKERLVAIPGATFIETPVLKLPLTPEQREKVHKPSFGIPSLSMFSLGARTEKNHNPGNGHFWFSPIIPRTGEGYVEASRVIRKAAKQLGLPITYFSPPVASWTRAFIVVIAFPVVRDIEANRKMRAGIKELIRICAEHGWGEYRTAPAFYDTVLNTYSFNNHVLRRFNETLKDALDPKGILSAGRYGIWPKHLRKDRT